MYKISCLCKYETLNVHFSEAVFSLFQRKWFSRPSMPLSSHSFMKTVIQRYILRDMILEKSLTGTPDVYDHTLTHLANKYRSDYDKAAISCGPLLVYGNAHMHNTNQTKKCLLL